GDYGLDILRSGLGIPVVGCGDAALEEAARLGRTFALVTTWPRRFDGLHRQAGAARARARAGCRGILSIGGEEDLTGVSQPGGYLSRIAAGEAGILDRLRDACRHAVERNGAEVIVLGCTCLSSVAETLARDCSVPVVNPRLAGVRSALRQVAQDSARANAGFRAESLDVLKSMLDAVADTPPEACPTCVGDHLDPQAHPSRGA
ncbi:aspartate/glutamate racemase family protein, partial [Caulobacter sp. BP25]|uniref:aspartate/glutamate racemase family protein n=1 Tax=Caulobacter sp. BP25 TaxID=2048900 RepID=UPI000C13B931